MTKRECSYHNRNKLLNGNGIVKGLKLHFYKPFTADHFNGYKLVMTSIPHELTEEEKEIFRLQFNQIK